MYRFTTNPPSRQIAPTPLLVPSVPRTDPLLAKIDAFLAHTDMTEGGFGRAVVGSFGLVRKLRQGEHIDESVTAKVSDFLDRAERAWKAVASQNGCMMTAEGC